MGESHKIKQLQSFDHNKKNNYNIKNDIVLLLSYNPPLSYKNSLS